MVGPNSVGILSQPGLKLFKFSSFCSFAAPTCEDAFEAFSIWSTILVHEDAVIFQMVLGIGSNLGIIVDVELIMGVQVEHVGCTNEGALVLYAG